MALRICFHVERRRFQSGIDSIVPMLEFEGFMISKCSMLGASFGSHVEAHDRPNAAVSRFRTLRNLSPFSDHLMLVANYSCPPLV